MRKIILLSLVTLLLPISVFAQSTTLKIGVVDVRSIVQKSPQLKAINSELTQKYRPREQAIVQAQANFKSEQDKFAKEASSMSDADRTKLEHQLISDRANLQAMITAFQQDLDNEQNGDMQKLLSQIASIVNDTAKEQHYDLILQGDNAPYVSDQLNLTNLILQKLSAKA